MGLETRERVYDSISEPVTLEKSEQKLSFMTQDREQVRVWGKSQYPILWGSELFLDHQWLVKYMQRGNFLIYFIFFIL